MRNINLIPKQEHKQKVICTNDVCQGECGECNFMTLVNIEEPKQETLEEAAKIHLNSGKIPNDYQSFIEGAKWQQEQNKKMFSEENLRTCFYDAKTPSYQDFGEWFEQFFKLKNFKQFKNK